MKNCGKKFCVTLYLVAGVGCGNLTSTIAPSSQGVAYISTKIADFSNSNSQEIEFGLGGGATPQVSYQCKLNNEEWRRCETPVEYSSLPDDEYIFVVQVLDQLGQVLGTASTRWLVDTTPPTVSILSKPNFITNQVASLVTFDAQDMGGSSVGSIQCNIDSLGWEDCPFAWNFILAPGDHKVQVRALDKAGNISSIESFTWTIDVTPPTLSIISTPSSETNDLSADFAFSAIDLGGGAVKEYQCKLDSDSYALCTSPQTYFSLSEGAHIFSVKAIDTAGNESLVESFAWTIDVTPPTLSVISKPSSETNDLSADFAFSAVDLGGGAVKEYQCKLDSDSYALCTSPQTYFSLSEGAHIFSVKAIDTAGNESLVESFAWTIDVTVPTVTIVTPSADGVLVPLSDMASFIVSGSCSEDGESVTLNGVPSVTTACNSGLWATSVDISGLADGVLSIRAKQTDRAGNEGSSLARTIVRDATAPQITITGAGPLRGGGNYGKISWSLTEEHVAAATHFSVELFDGTSWANVGTVAAAVGANSSTLYSLNSFPVPLLNISNAKVRISLADANGNSTISSSSDFIIDSSAPSLTSVTINDGAIFAGTSLLSVTVDVTDNYFNTGLAVLLKEANGATNDCQSEYSDNGWETYTDNLTSFIYIVAPTDGVKKICAWVKDGVGNISTISPTGGISGINFDTILYQRGNAPLIGSFSAVATSDGTMNAPQGSSVTISWSATDVEGLDNAPISFSYTTDNVLWKDITTNKDTSDQANITWTGGLAGNPTTSGLKNLIWNAPTSSYFRLRAIVRDMTGNRSLPIQSQIFNIPNWSVYAGTTDRGVGGTALSVTLASGVATKHFAVSPKNGDMYMLDSENGVFKLDSKTGVVSTFITKGAVTNLPDSGSMPENPSISYISIANLIFDSKGRLYVQEGYTLATIWQFDLTANTVRRYAGGPSNLPVNNDGGISATDLYLLTTQFVFDEDDTLYAMTGCTTNSYLAKRLVKIVQNSDGSAGTVTRVIGDCSFANPTNGTAYSQPVGVMPYANLVGLAVWDRGNAIYLAGYGSVPYKIINGIVYSTNMAVDSITGMFFNPSEQLLYVRANDGLNKVTPNLNGANGETAVQYLTASGAGGSCNEDDIDRLSYCGRIGYTVWEKNGLVYFTDGTVNNSFSTYRIRYVNSDGKIKTLMGTMPLFGIGKDARIARGAFAGIYYKKSIEPNLTAFPEGLYFMESAGGVFGRINPLSRVIESIWGNQDRTSRAYNNGDAVSPTKSMGAPYWGGDLMLLTFDNTGLPWLRWDFKLGRLNTDMTLDIKTVGGAGYWHDASDNGTNASDYSLYVFGGKSNLTLKDEKLFLMGSAYIQNPGLDPRVRIMAFDYAANTTTKLMGGNSVASNGKWIQADVTVPGGVAATDIWWGCAYIDACYTAYDAATDRLYFSEYSRVRYIHPATNPSGATLTTLHTDANRIYNLTVNPSSTQVWFMVGTDTLICKDISSGKSWCDGVTNHFAGPAAAGYRILNGPNNLTWKDDSTLFISDYLGQVWQYNVLY